MNHTKPLFTGSFRNLKVCMSTRAKITNHYDTLNVNKDSTQEEIKASYYELTKKYHPDKNTTQEAKTKFQDVSNAYEVLGNFHKRKLYDRDLMARGAIASKNTSYTAPEDNLAGFHKSRASNATKSTDAYRNYDFDAWTKAHYGNTLRKQLQKQRFTKEREAWRIRTRQQEEINLKDCKRFISIFCAVILSGMVMQSVFFNYDKPVRKKNSDN